MYFSPQGKKEALGFPPAPRSLPTPEEANSSHPPNRPGSPASSYSSPQYGAPHLLSIQPFLRGQVRPQLLMHPKSSKIKSGWPLVWVTQIDVLPLFRSDSMGDSKLQEAAQIPGDLPLLRRGPSRGPNGQSVSGLLHWTSSMKVGVGG